MRVLVLRVGVLGAIAVLGWIAIAQAQRGSNNLTVVDPAGGPTMSTDDSSRPRATPPTDANPLRTPVQPPARSVPPTSGPAARPPAADLFGLQAQRAGGGGSALAPASPPPATTDSIPDAAATGLPARQRAAANASQYSQMATAARADQSVGGPTLISGDSGQPGNDRVATKSGRAANRGSDLQTLPTAAVESQEPASLPVNPFAKPASSTRGAKSDQGGPSTLSPLADSGRAADVALESESEGNGQPGGKQLEGLQSPQLTIQKVAPKEIQVGKPAVFRVTVRNVGQVPACEVEVRDLVPKGTRLLGTTPQATRGARSEIIWTLGTIRPGEESTVEMQLSPTVEGEIGSVATVHFGADASARSVATRPQLVVETTAPPKVLIGEQMTLNITISNPGTGVATGVVLEERIPPGLQHPAGTELEYEVGDLKPGETRKLDLPLVAKQAGPTTNILSARGDGNLRAERKLDLEVVAPQLDVLVEGPKKRYLERQATYTVSVTNPGTASAKQVELLATLPAGLKFVSANNAGYYEESTRTVRWRLEELPANETGSVELVTLPVETGQHAIKLRSTAQKGLTAEKEQAVMVEGIAAILFQVSETVDPLEVGKETTYEVHVVNQGSKAAANVRLAVDLPSEMKPVAAEGPTRNFVEGSRVQFDGLARLAPKADTTYRVRVKGLRPGDLRARFQLLTDDMQSPVTKEESTRVYADE